MSNLKGKILFIISSLIALVLTAGGAAIGYAAGYLLESEFASTLVAYDWAMIKIVITAILGVLILLITLPSVITARQVCRMYNVSQKYAKWSVSTTIIGVLMLLFTAGLIALVVYGIAEWSGLITLLLGTVGLSIDIMSIQIGLGVGIFVLFLLLFLPLLVSLRGRDSVSAMLRKKRAHSDVE